MMMLSKWYIIFLYYFYWIENGYIYIYYIFANSSQFEYLNKALVVISTSAEFIQSMDITFQELQILPFKNFRYFLLTDITSQRILPLKKFGYYLSRISDITFQELQILSFNGHYPSTEITSQ